MRKTNPTVHLRLIIQDTFKVSELLPVYAVVHIDSTNTCTAQKVTIHQVIAMLAIGIDDSTLWLSPDLWHSVGN